MGRGGPAKIGRLVTGPHGEKPPIRVARVSSRDAFFVVRFGGKLGADCVFIHAPTAGLCLPSDHPPSRHWASAFALGATGSHLSHFSVTPRLVTSYTAPLGSVRWFHRLGLTDSRGSHPLWALPRLNLCPYYSASCCACQGLFRNFLSLSFHPLGSPSGLARLIRSLTPTLRATSSSRVAYQSQRLPTFRATATCSGGHPDPLGIIPFRWSYCITLGWVCQGFFEDFFRGSSNLVLGYKRIVRLSLRHFGVPLLGYDP